MTKRHAGSQIALIIAIAVFVAQSKAFAQENSSGVGDVVVDAITAGEISVKRGRDAVGMAFDYMLKNGKAASDDAVAKAILPAFKKANPAVEEAPKAALLTAEECAKAAAQSIIKATDAKYPIKDEKQLAEEAVERYPLYKKGDHVKVFYAKNPQMPNEVSGVYYGTNRGIVMVGTSRIRIDDMLHIEDYRDEVLKFDPEATEELREEFIKRLQHNTARSREEFIEENSNAIIQAEIAAFAKRNEENGYTCIDDTWMPALPFLTAATAKARVKLARYEKEKHQEQVDEQLDVVGAQADSLAVHWTVVPSTARLNPSAVLQDKANREKKLADAEAKRKADEEARQQEAETAEKEAEEARRASETAAKAASAKRVDEEEARIRQIEEQSKKKQQMMIIIGCAALLALIIIIIIIMKVRAEREKNRFKRFFEGKGKVQKDFWDMAAADPKNFKYVAYMFPGLKEASRALTRLTYITAMPNGELKCTRDILFGVYPHQNGAVAFVGGKKFHYALWREASAVLPELEGATYFKVSEEPEVKLDIPDIKKIGKEGEIESLGIEDVTDNEGSFTRCYKYRIPSRETAMAFLENFQINEEGIVVQVETNDGILGKDENGIFTA
ncbi:MAG: hypothetical protein J5833_07295 [Victivallales bacterium]|nr:hypothetical protein [Victivallales bacterium]